MQKAKSLIYSCVAMILFWSCGSHYTPMAEYSGYALGATYHVVCDTKNETLGSELEILFRNLDHSISVWDSLSTVSQFNRSANGVWADRYFTDLLTLSKRIHAETEGAFNPAIFPVLQAMKPRIATDSTKKLSPDSLLKISRLEDIIISRDSGNGSLRFVQKRFPKSGLNFQGIAQGYAVDIICAFLDSKSIANYKVEVGRQFRTKGYDPTRKAWEMSLDKPTLSTETRIVESIIPVGEKAVSIAGDYREFYEKDGRRYNNYVNPFTGKMGEDPLLNAYVFAPTAAEADAYASAFMVMGAGKTTQFLSKRKDMQAYLISSGFDADFLTWMSPELEKLIEKSK